MAIQDVGIFIPARRAATRLPEKLLLAETGRPLILHTCEQAAAYGKVQVTVCTDDDEIARLIEAAGYRSFRSQQDHQSGTDRIIEAVDGIHGSESPSIIVNVQGDEPEIAPEAIRQVVDLLAQHPWADIATLCAPAGADAQVDPNQVKVVRGADDRALWFSRAPVIYERDRQSPMSSCERHLGLYAYRREALQRWPQLPVGRLETCEKLEQLRALEHGLTIACGQVTTAWPGIDVRADYDAFLTRWNSTQPQAEQVSGHG